MLVEHLLRSRLFEVGVAVLEKRTFDGPEKQVFVLREGGLLGAGRFGEGAQGVQMGGLVAGLDLGGRAGWTHPGQGTFSVFLFVS